MSCVLVVSNMLKILVLASVFRDVDGPGISIKIIIMIDVLYRMQLYDITIHARKRYLNFYEK